MGRTVPGLPDGWMKVCIYGDLINFNFFQNENSLTSCISCSMLNFYFFFASFLTS